VMERGGVGWGAEGNRGNGDAAGDGDSAVGDRPPQVDMGARSFQTRRGRSSAISVISDRCAYFCCLFNKIGRLLILPIGWPQGASGRVLVPNVRVLVASVYSTSWSTEL